MKDSKEGGHEIIHVQKCGGVPKYPSKYVFDMERPESMTDEEIIASKERVCNFLSKNGINIFIDELEY